jgi:aromatic-L-amino-acid decarboxylase
MLLCTCPELSPADIQWAGVAFALPEQRGPLRLDEVNKYADSFCTNMHKWGLVGFDCCEC